MKKILTLSIALLFATVSVAQAQQTIPNRITESTTLTADQEWILDGYTFVITPDGAAEPTVLTIEPGTVIKATETPAGEERASSLIITRGAQINANGTAAAPIVFTSVLDEPLGTLTRLDTRLWGGVIILGDASINSRADGEVVAAPVEDQVEGFTIDPEDVPLITFGGTNDADNSGVFRYVSIRHGGFPIGEGNEINGLTMGGVGSETVIEFVEVFATKDDGFEWFGGTVNGRYLVAAFGNDDAFDFDTGWRGNGQFWFSIGADNPLAGDSSDNGGEHDGATSPLDATPLGDVTVFNATYIGTGNSANDGSYGLRIRDNAGVMYANSIFTDFVSGIRIEGDNEDRFNAGEVTVMNSIFNTIGGANNTVDGVSGDSAVDAAQLFNNAMFGNMIGDPMLGSIGRDDDGMLDPRPTTMSPAVSMDVATVPSDGFFEQVNYVGAFDPFAPTTWLNGWTKLSQDGYLDEPELPFSAYVPLADGFFATPFGDLIFSPNSGWILHREHGLLYVNVAAEGVYLYDLFLDTWLFTTEDLYPTLYVFGAGVDNFVFYFEGTTSPREFVNLDTGAAIFLPRSL